jgi:hypothetical protein
MYEDYTPVTTSNSTECLIDVIKIFKVEFKGEWPVPCGLVIAAVDREQAYVMAKNTIKHTDKFLLTEVHVAEPCVIFYESGEY